MGTSEEINQRVQGLLERKFPNLLACEKPYHEVLNSLEIIELMMMVEKEFNIRIHAIEFSPTIFTSVETIRHFVQNKRGAAA